MAEIQLARRTGISLLNNMKFFAAASALIVAVSAQSPSCSSCLATTGAAFCPTTVASGQPGCCMFLCQHVFSAARATHAPLLNSSSPPPSLERGRLHPGLHGLVRHGRVFVPDAVRGVRGDVDRLLVRPVQLLL